MRIQLLHSLPLMAAFVAGCVGGAPALAERTGNTEPAPDAGAFVLAPVATSLGELAADESDLSIPELQESTASRPQTSDSWRWRVAPYLWAAGIDGTFTIGSLRAEAEFDFSDIFDHVEGGFMLAGEGHKGQFGIVVDGMYMKVEGDGETPTGADVDVEITSWMLEGAGLYRLTPASPFEIGAGVRYLGMEFELQLGSLPKVQSDEDSLDAIIVGRATWPFVKHWHASLYADVGAGDADLTWQAVANVGYDFNGWGLALGYRVLDYEFENDPAELDLTISGLILGVNFRF